LLVASPLSCSILPDCPGLARIDARRMTGADVQRLWSSPELAGLLGRSLDCVAVRADLRRDDVYSWVKGALPTDVWQLLWASAHQPALPPAPFGSSELFRRPADDFADDDDEEEEASEPIGQKDGNLMKSDLATVAAFRSLVGASAAERSVATSKAYVPRHRPRSAGPAMERSGADERASSRHLQTAMSHEGAGFAGGGPARWGHSFNNDVTLDTTASEPMVRRGTLAEFFKIRNDAAFGDNAGVIADGGYLGTPRHATRQPEPWSGATTMMPESAREYGTEIRPFTDRSVDDTLALARSRYTSPEKRSSTPRGRIDVDPQMRETMSAWLDLGMSPSTLTPLQVADWVRTLPQSKVNKETKKALARRVLQYRVDGEDLEAMLNEGRWAELDLQDERESVTLLGLFKQAQHEMAMAEAARQAARSNASRKTRRAEMLVA